MKDRDIYNIKDLPRGRGSKRLLGGERSWEFTSSDEESFLSGK